MSKEEVDKTELVLELLGIAAGIVLAVLQTRRQFRQQYIGYNPRESWGGQ